MQQNKISEQCSTPPGVFYTYSGNEVLLVMITQNIFCIHDSFRKGSLCMNIKKIKYLFITGESHKYEETLQCVEADKDIPDRLEVNEPGGQTGDPCQTHNDSQSMEKYTEWGDDEY